MNAIDAEEARLAGRLLGGCMTDPSILADLVGTGMTASEWGVARMQALWSVCVRLHADAGRADPTLVVDALTTAMSGDVSMARLTVEFCLREPVRRRGELPGLLEHMRRRVAVRRLDDLLTEQLKALRADRADVTAISTRLQRRLSAIESASTAVRSVDGRELAAISQHRIATGTPLLPRFPLGLPGIDEMLGGGAAIGRVAVVMADSGVGKSTYASHIVRAALDAGRKVLWFSFEADRSEISEALIEARAGYRYPSGRSTREMDAAFGSAQAWIADAPIWIDDSSGLPVEDVATRIRAHREAHDVDVVIVDYVQSIRTTESHGRGDMAYIHISETLRALAKDERIGIVELSQVAERKREEKTTHTAFSKQFERDAAALLLIERNRSDKNPKMRDVGKVTLLKNRFGGRLGEEFMRYDHGRRCLVPCTPHGESVSDVRVSDAEDSHDETAWR